jgi:hypothetical protein
MSNVLGPPNKPPAELSTIHELDQAHYFFPDGIAPGVTLNFTNPESTTVIVGGPIRRGARLAIRSKDAFLITRGELEEHVSLAMAMGHLTIGQGSDMVSLRDGAHVLTYGTYDVAGAISPLASITNPPTSRNIAKRPSAQRSPLLMPPQKPTSHNITDRMRPNGGLAGLLPERPIIRHWPGEVDPDAHNTHG